MKLPFVSPNTREVQIRTILAPYLSSFERFESRIKEIIAGNSIKNQYGSDVISEEMHLDFDTIRIEEGDLFAPATGYGRAFSSDLYEFHEQGDEHNCLFEALKALGYQDEELMVNFRELDL